MRHLAFIAFAALAAVVVGGFPTAARAGAAAPASAAVAPAPSVTLRGDVDRRLLHGIDLTYNLRFAEAEAWFDTLIAADPDNPAGHFFRAMVAWWRVLIDLEDHSHDQAFYELLDRSIEVCDRRLKQDPDDFDAILFKGGAIGFRGRLRGDRGQFLRSARDGLRSLPLLEKSRQLEPTNKDILFGQGIYNYFAEVIPQRHPIVRPVMAFLPDGDRELGLRQLEEVARDGRYARAEAKYFLAQIYRLFEADDEAALPYLEALHEAYPRNALFHRYRARTLMAVGRRAEGLGLYEEVVARSEAGLAGYHTRGHIEALYYLGREAFRRRRYGTALQLLRTADDLSLSLGDDREAQAAGGYTALTDLYLGMVLDALDRRQAALRRYARALALPGAEPTRKLARRYRETPYRP